MILEPANKLPACRQARRGSWILEPIRLRRIRFLSLTLPLLCLLLLASCSQTSSGGGGGGGGDVSTPGVYDITINSTTYSGSIAVENFASTSTAVIVAYSQPATSPTVDGSRLYSVSASGPAASSRALSDRNFELNIPVCRKQQMEFSEYLRQQERQIIETVGPPSAKKSERVKALTIPVGSTESFYVFPNASATPVVRVATLESEGTYCYVYVDQSITVSAESITWIRDQFDNNIYPKNRAAFGNEKAAGVNGESKVTLLLSDLGSTLYGYFYGIDFYPQTTYTSSNQRKILYLNGRSGFIPEIPPTAYHEFQHMINFSQKSAQGVTEDTWLNEGLSMYAEQMGGYGLPGAVAGRADNFAYNAVYAYESAPQDNPLTVWASSNAHYGVGYLFVLYLYEQYGAAAVKSLETSDKVGIANVENATAADFDVIFGNWVVANYMDGISTDSKYNYSSIDMRGTYQLSNRVATLEGVSTTDVVAYPYDSTSRTLHNYSTEYLLLSGGTGTTLNISLTGASDAALGGKLIVR